MSKLDFYSFFASPPCRAVHAFMEVCKIPFDYHVINLAKGEQQSEEFLKVNPHGKVPAIRHDGFLLTESVAILQYLSEKFKTEDHWYPTDAKKRAKIDEYLAWHHSNCRHGAGVLFFNVAILTKLRKQPRNEEAIKEKKAKLTEVLNFFENYFLKGSNFINSDEISIADILAIIEFQQIKYIGIDVGKNRSNVKAWQQRVIAKLGSTFGSIHEPLANMIEQMQISEDFE